MENLYMMEYRHYKWSLVMVDKNIVDKNYVNSILKENITHVSDNRPFSIHYTSVQKDADLILYLHWHEEIEFFYIDKGEALLIIENEQYHLHTGEAILIPPNLLHMAEWADGRECSFYALVFNPKVLSESYTNSTYNRFVQPVLMNRLQYVIILTNRSTWQEEALLLLKDIFGHIHDDIGSWELKFHGLLYLIWHLIFNNHISTVCMPDNYYNLSIKLAASIEFIHSNYMNEITLNELASISHLSSSVFCRYFKQLTGFTPFHYLLRYKIVKCCELLSGTDMSITDIAGECGFNNISHFNREFQKHVKMNPSNYRRKA